MESACQHLEFAAAVIVGRQEQNGRLVGLQAQVRVHCRVCGQRMQFVPDSLQVVEANVTAIVSLWPQAATGFPEKSRRPDSSPRRVLQGNEQLTVMDPAGGAPQVSDPVAPADS